MLTMTEDQTLIKQQTRRVLRIFSKRKGNLAPVLQQIKSRFGYLPRKAMLKVAKFLKILVIDVYSAVTFYNQFYINHLGRHLAKVCTGTAYYIIAPITEKLSEEYRGKFKCCKLNVNENPETAMK